MDFKLLVSVIYSQAVNYKHAGKKGSGISRGKLRVSNPNSEPIQTDVLCSIKTYIQHYCCHNISLNKRHRDNVAVRVVAASK